MRLLIAITLLMFAVPVFGADFYISPTGSDAGDGSIGSPWKSLGFALNKYQNGGSVARISGAGGVANTLYLRAGVHSIAAMTSNSGGPHIQTNQSASDGRLTIKSYPGEWAILDATGESRAIAITGSVHNITFENFEIRNANIWGIDAKNDGAWEAVMVSNGVFRNLYIHDNDNNSDHNSNPGGILVSMQDSIIEYCTFTDNGTAGSSHHNSANLQLMGNYQNTAGELAPYPRKNNVIQYNVFDGSSTSIKDKGPNSFVDSATNCSGSKVLLDLHPEWANEIHHNVFLNNAGSAFYSVSDYTKFHHNLVSNGARGYYMVNELDACQVVYKIEIYNNTFFNLTGADITVPSQPTSGMGYDHDVYNNLHIDPSYQAVILTSGQSTIWPMTYDHNGYDTGEATMARYLNYGDINFAAWQSYGYDTDSLNEALTLTDAAGDDYTLPEGSNAIGAGRAGADLGAFETDWYASAGYTGLAAPTITCYLDSDGDLYSNGTSESVEICSADYYESGDLTATSGDCNDGNTAINPGATDICGNGIVEDCVADVACPSSSNATTCSGSFSVR